MKILMAVDIGDENADALVNRAAAWGLRLSGTVDLLHVDSFPYAVGHVHDVAAQSLLAKEYGKLRSIQAERMAGLLDKLPDTVRGQVVQRQSNRPAEAIVETAAAYDLVLVGTHGRTGLSSLFVGSVAERVVRQATVPTLVLRS